jgi:hypothetical protein
MVTKTQRHEGKKAEYRRQKTGDKRVSGDQVGGDRENGGSSDSLLMIDYLLLIRARVGLLDGCF